MEQQERETNNVRQASVQVVTMGSLVLEYKGFVEDLFKTKADNYDWNMAHAALGIGGEAGEVVDLIKKTFANGRELDKDKLTKELGDLMFYIQALCNVTGIPLMEVLAECMRKLRMRYPNGYSDQAAQERRDEKGA